MSLEAKKSSVKFQMYRAFEDVAVKQYLLQRWVGGVAVGRGRQREAARHSARGLLQLDVLRKSCTASHAPKHSGLPVPWPHLLCHYQGGVVVVG